MAATMAESVGPAPIRSDTLQKMLALEKQFKLERLQGHASSPITPTSQLMAGHLPLQCRRVDAAVAPQDQGTLRTVRRSMATATLTINVPPPKKQHKRGLHDEKIIVNENEKAVTFLDLQEDDMSDHSSICQSPSWEGWGQQKKKKKDDASQRKREKEQADRDAKANRRRNESRLRKPPPPALQAHAGPHASSDRSLSGSTLTAACPIRPSASSSHSSAEVSLRRRDDMAAKSNAHQPKEAFHDGKRHADATHWEPGRDAASQQRPGMQAPTMAQGNVHPNKTEVAQEKVRGPPSSSAPTRAPRTMTEPIIPTVSNVHTTTRPPVTRHRSNSIQDRTHSLLSATANKMRFRMGKGEKPANFSSTNTSLESVHQSPAERGREKGGFFRRRERSVDTVSSRVETGVGSPHAAVASPPDSASSKRGRCFSLTAAPIAAFQETRRDADDLPIQGHLKDGNQKNDYFSFLKHPYSPPAPGSKPDGGRLSTSSLSRKTFAQDLPSPSAMGLRGFRDRARAALNRTSMPTPPTQPTPGTSFSRPFTHKQSMSATGLNTGEPTYLLPTSKAARILGEQEINATTIVQAGSQGTSGSSSSSSASYADTLPSPTSVTTPNSSRPESQRDLPVTIGAAEVARGKVGPLTSPHDERAKRRSHEAVTVASPAFTMSPASVASPGLTTIRGESQGSKEQKAFIDSRNEVVHRQKEPNHMDMADAQSFMTSLTTLDATESTASLIPQPLTPGLPKTLEHTVAADKATETSGRERQPSLAKSHSDPDLSQTVMQPTVKRQVFIPYRPKKSDQTKDSPTARHHQQAHEPAKRPRTSESETGKQQSPNNASYLEGARKNKPAATRGANGTAAAMQSVPKALQPGTGAGGGVPALPQQEQPSPGPLPHERAKAAAGLGPMAKMFVECCSCKFFHDMPSRVYECMASPDSVVEDRSLGVRGAITTAVKCPWCAHSMSTRCCAGYAAVVYLKEKLH